MNPLPPLRHNGADFTPILIVDTREQCPLIFTRLPSEPGTLATGDYSTRGLTDKFAIERKSIEDLTGCVAGERERFERELARMDGLRFKRLLIVGSRDAIAAHDYHSKVSPASVMGSLYSWEQRFGVPFLFEPDPEKAAAIVELWAYYAVRDVFRTEERVVGK